MLAGKISQESRHVPPHTRELCRGEGWLHEPTLRVHIAGLIRSLRQRLDAIRPSPSHPGEAAANHRHEHCCHAERRDKLLSLHSTTSPVRDRKESGIVSPIWSISRLASSKSDAHTSAFFYTSLRYAP